MVRKIAAFALVLLAAAPAHAQFAVIDNANLAQAILIVQRTQRHLEELRAQYLTIQRMARGLGSMDRYRTPPIALTGHDPELWLYGAPWIAALNGGDPLGTAYRSTALPLEPPGPASRLTGAARRTFERQYGNVEIADSVAIVGGHQVGITRTYSNQLQRALEALEADVLSPAASYHEMTAILDKIAAGELLGRRQDVTANQLLSHTLEQLIARSKRVRDNEVAAINMQLVSWRDGDVANQAFRNGMGDALQTWRQP